MKKYIVLLIVVGIVGGITGFLESEKSMEITKLQRNPPGEGGYTVNFEIDAEGLLEKHPIEITIEEEALREQEIRTIFKKASEELEEVILGENERKEHIKYDLVIPNTLQNGLVEVALTFDQYQIIDDNGAILQENLKEDSYLVGVTGELSCQGSIVTHEFFLQVFPKEESEKETLLKDISTAVEKENYRIGEDSVTLPAKIDEYQISWYPISEKIYWKIFLLGMMVIALIYLCEKRKKENTVKEREKQLMMDYPEIVSQLSLLTGAGMTIGGAWERIVVKYKNQKKLGKMMEREGYEEMIKTLHEIKDGVGEIKAYERFGTRCQHPSYRKLASLLTQNIRKGSKGLQQLLDAEAKEAFSQRKLQAKKLGEEAGTKLLLPMGIMLILVFLILMVPATLALRM